MTLKIIYLEVDGKGNKFYSGNGEFQMKFEFYIINSYYSEVSAYLFGQ